MFGGVIIFSCHGGAGNDSTSVWTSAPLFRNSRFSFPDSKALFSSEAWTSIRPCPRSDLLIWWGVWWWSGKTLHVVKPDVFYLKILKHRGFPELKCVTLKCIISGFPPKLKQNEHVAFNSSFPVSLKNMYYVIYSCRLKFGHPTSRLHNHWSKL